MKTKTTATISHDDNSGDWQNLRTSSQAPRYTAIAKILRGSRDVLDIGCGEGLLRGWLPADINYLGLDPSSLAIQNAAILNPSGKFIHVEAERFDTPERFTSIVFNEMLYYVADPIGLVQKYTALLAPDGVILCSIFQKEDTSLKRKVRHLLDHRRPVSNTHCEKMVRAHMARWRILEDHEIGRWHIWLAQPFPSASISV